MTTLSEQVFNMQKPISGLHDKEIKQKGYREIALGAKEEDGEQDLWLNLLDKDPASGRRGESSEKQAYINLYLGRSKTFKKGTSPKNHNVVVPIIPRCYTTPDRDPAQAAKPPKGWLYIIRQFDVPQGTVVELWRELESDGLGNFSDVNLKNFKEKDHRKPTGQPGFRIILPYCIDKKAHHLWIAFSEVQWSWARIQSMKKDPELRNKRMHKLDLSDCLNNFAKSNFTAVVDKLEPMVEKLGSLSGFAKPLLQSAKPLIDKAAFKLGQALSSGSNPEDPAGENKDQAKKAKKENTALLYNLKSAPDTFSKKLPDDLKDPIPVVYLDNPVGIAKSLGAVYQYACMEMKDYVSLLKDAPQLLQGDPPKDANGEKPSNRESRLKELDAQPYDPVRWFESAVVLNRYLYTDFPDIAPDDWTKEQKDEFSKLKTEAEEKFLNYRSKIDKADLDRALGTEKRKGLRRAIENTKGWLTDFLNQELVSQGEESALLQALDDHFTLPAKIEGVRPVTKKKGEKDITIWPDNYADGWKAFTEIICHLGKHIYAHDADLIAPAPDGWSLRKKDPGVEFLANIADPQKKLSLHERLFPKLAGDGDTLAFDKSPVENHNPIFKFKHFEKLAKNDLARAADTVTNFLRQFEEVIAMDDRKDAPFVQMVERIKESLPRLINGVLQTKLEKVHVPVPDLLAFKQEAAGDFQGIRRPALAIGATVNACFKDANEVMKQKVNSATDISLKFDSGGKHVQTVKTAKGSGYTLKNVVLTRASDATGVTDLKTTSSVGDEVKLRPTGSNNYKPKQRPYDLTAVMIVEEDVRDRLVERIGTNEAAIRAVGGLITVVETINLVNSLQAVMTNKNDDKKGKLFAELLSSFCDLGSAIGNMVDSAHSFQKTDFSKGIFKAGTLDDPAKAVKAGRILQAVGHIGSIIDLGLTLESLIENYQQNDDAYIGDSVMFVGFAITALGDTAAAAPLAALVGLSAAWITVIGLLVLLIGYLVKRYIFPEDSHFEIWLANGPFACGKRSHPHFRYSRQVGIITVHDKNGQPAQKTCTVHIYDNNALYVDATGNLVQMLPESSRQGIGPAPGTKYDKFKLDQTGKVYLKVGKHPDIEKDTLIGTIGQPYTPHPLLQTQTAPSENRFQGHRPGDDPMRYAQLRRAGGRRLIPDPNPDQYDKYRFALWCENPHEAYNALLDALYRPIITSKQVMLKRSWDEFVGGVALHIHAPFLLPKSNLFIQFWRLKSECVKSALDPDFEAKLTEDMIESYSISTHQVTEESNEQQPANATPTIKDLEDGPNRYTIRFTNYHTTYCKLKVRIDLFGTGKTCLPCEPLFCGSDISKDKTEKTGSEEKTAIAGRPNTAESSNENDDTKNDGFRWVELEKFFLPEWR
jgi:hypothetical protein